MTEDKAVPNLLRQYEQQLTLSATRNSVSSPRGGGVATMPAAFSPRSQSVPCGVAALNAPASNPLPVRNPNLTLTAAAARNSSGNHPHHVSPRAVFHSPRAFEDRPPFLNEFSPRRKALSKRLSSELGPGSDAQAAAATLEQEISTVAAAASAISPRRVKLNFDEEKKADEDDDEEEEEKAITHRDADEDEDIEEKAPAPLSTTSSSSQPKSPSAKKQQLNKEDSCEDGCLICMDEFSARRKAYPLPCTGNCTGAFVHYRCIMAWLGQSGSCPLCRGACDPLVLQPLQKLDIENMVKVALQPVPLDAGIIRCYVKQVYRGMFKQYSYELYLQGQVGTDEEDKFLLAARRQVRSNMTANYVICTDKECSDSARIGRMGSNFLGTCFTMYDNGRDPQKLAKIQDAVSSEDETNVLQIREELGCVTYEPNRTSVGPRKMRVVIPDVDENGNSSKIVVRPLNRQDRLVHRLNRGDLRDLMKFSNREPVFREDLGAYCLDFGGRVSMASVKNFQLINPDDPSMGNILQFGRVADDMFTMDFQWPLSPFQAFGICLSSCDTKLACV